MANEELRKRVYVRQLKEDLNLNQVCGDDSSLNRYIFAPDINRPGLELTGYNESNDLKRVFILGNKEYEYLNKYSEQEQYEKIKGIIDLDTPCIILAGHFKLTNSVKRVCDEKNVPVFIYDGKTYQLIVDVVNYLSEKLAPSGNEYGVMMNIYGKGIMITGESGIGKSELALDLIKRGHMLVADDRVDVSRVHNSIICRAPKLLRRMLEIRGLGIIDVTRLFGISSYLSSCELNFVIRLVRLNETIDNDRLNPITKTISILGLDYPVLVIPITEGKSLSVIIESAVSDYILKKTGIDSNEEFKQNVMNEILENGGKQ